MVDALPKSVHLAKVNFEAIATTAFFVLFVSGPLLLLGRAARDTAHHPAVMPATKSLLWAAGNGYMWIGQSTAEQAARMREPSDGMRVASRWIRRLSAAS